jgi:tetratricopeptide (TPR) repeat protein
MKTVWTGVSSVCCAIMLMCMLFPAYGQDATDMHRQLETARGLAFEGRYDESLGELGELLALEPGCLEARLLYARIYGWKGQYDSARKVITEVLSRDSTQREALELSVNIEYWSRQFEFALLVVDGALRNYPGDDVFLLRRVLILKELGRHQAAEEDLLRLLDNNPANSEALALMKQTKGEHLNNGITLFYGVDFFSDAYMPAHYSSLQVGRMTALGSASARLNFAHRFEQSGIQPEIEFYPKLTENIYLYLDYVGRLQTA